MKLYTEEQVIDILQSGSFLFDDEEVNEIISKMTTIELPSDDEICDEAESIAHNYFVMQKGHYQGLEEGAKRMAYWLMKRIKSINNETKQQ